MKAKLYKQQKMKTEKGNGKFDDNEKGKGKYNKNVEEGKL